MQETCNSLYVKVTALLTVMIKNMYTFLNLPFRSTHNLPKYSFFQMKFSRPGLLLKDHVLLTVVNKNEA